MGERQNARGQLVPSFFHSQSSTPPHPNPPSGRFDWHNEVKASWHKAALGGKWRHYFVCVRVCVKGCLSWQSHPGPTGLLITFSVTWHLLRENDRASTANMDIAALSLSLVSVDPSCRLALRLLDSIYMYDWFNTWTVLFMTSGPNTQTQSQTHTHTHTRTIVNHQVPNLTICLYTVSPG